MSTSLCLAILGLTGVGVGGVGVGGVQQGPDIDFQYTLNGLPVVIKVHYYSSEPTHYQRERRPQFDFTVEVLGDSR